MQFAIHRLVIRAMTWETVGTTMKRPSLRVTKWLGDIPVEAECTACPDLTFKVKPITHRPNREEYGKYLQQEFDRHLKHVHKRGDAPEHDAP
jgi:hypothetical protein